jgi:hypothetical protein
MSVVIGLLDHTLDVEARVGFELELVVVAFVSMEDREQLDVDKILFDQLVNIMEDPFSCPWEKENYFYLINSSFIHTSKPDLYNFLFLLASANLTCTGLSVKSRIKNKRNVWMYW